MPIGIALWLILVSCSTKNEKTDDNTVALEEASWTDVDYYQAKAYVTSTPYLLGEIVANGKLVPQVWDTAGVKLTGQQVLRLKQILTQLDKDDDYAVSDCFYPRHGIVLWDKANKPVAHLSVCFECNQLKAKPQVDKLDLREIKELFVELGVPVFEDPIQHEQYFKTVNGKDAR